MNKMRSRRASPRTAAEDRTRNRPRQRRRKSSNVETSQAIKVEAKRKYEKYLARARDAVRLGDKIEAENLYQHADHWLREMCQ